MLLSDQKMWLLILTYVLDVMQEKHWCFTSAFSEQCLMLDSYPHYIYLLLLNTYVKENKCEAH